MRLLVLAALVLASCKRDKSAAPPPAAPPAPMPVPQPPASTAEQDALWRLAPEGTQVGFVASSRGVRSMESALLAIKKLFDTSPDLKGASVEVDVELRKVFGTSKVTLETIGMSRSKGMALFRLVNGGEVVVLPVVDRAKFVAALKGTKASDGELVDGYVCKPIKDVYACAKSGELLAKLGTGPMHEDIKIAGARGDVEIIGDVPDALGVPVTIAAVGQLARGTVVVRGGIEGLPEELTGRIRAIGTPRIEATKAVAFWVLNLAPLLADLPVPEEDIAPGVALDTLVDALDAPITMSLAPGAKQGELRIPVQDPALAQRLLDRCGQVEPLMMFSASARDGVCHVTLAPVSVNLDAWLESDAIHVGHKGVAPSSATLASTPIATELASGNWAFAVYGRGTLLGATPPPLMPPGVMYNPAKLGLRAVIMINELGVGLRTDGETLQFVASLRTAWSNPDDVVARIVAISPNEVMQGKAAAIATQIAKAFPSSPFATDLQGDLYGLLIPSAVIGIVGGAIEETFQEDAAEEAESNE